MLIQDFWKNRSNTEKGMIGVILLLLLMIILSWSRVSEGLKKGMKPYQKQEQITK